MRGRDPDGFVTLHHGRTPVVVWALTICSVILTTAAFIQWLGWQ